MANFVARVKASARHSRYVFFSGREFTKAEWRVIPAEFVEQSKSADYKDILEVKSGKDVKDDVKPTVETMPANQSPPKKEESKTVVVDEDQNDESSELETEEEEKSYGSRRRTTKKE